MTKRPEQPTQDGLHSRKPYEKPCIEETGEFERLVLSCTKLDEYSCTGGATAIKS